MKASPKEKTCQFKTKEPTLPTSLFQSKIPSPEARPKEKKRNETLATFQFKKKYTPAFTSPSQYKIPSPEAVPKGKKRNGILVTF